MFLYNLNLIIVINYKQCHQSKKIILNQVENKKEQMQEKNLLRYKECPKEMYLYHKI